MVVRCIASMFFFTGLALGLSHCTNRSGRKVEVQSPKCPIQEKLSQDGKTCVPITENPPLNGGGSETDGNPLDNSYTPPPEDTPGGNGFVDAVEGDAPGLDQSDGLDATGSDGAARGIDMTMEPGLGSDVLDGGAGSTDGASDGSGGGTDTTDGSGKDKMDAAGEVDSSGDPVANPSNTTPNDDALDPNLKTIPKLRLALGTTDLTYHLSFTSTEGVSDVTFNTALDVAAIDEKQLATTPSKQVAISAAPPKIAIRFVFDERGTKKNCSVEFPKLLPGQSEEQSPNCAE